MHALALVDVGVHLPLVQERVEPAVRVVLWVKRGSRLCDITEGFAHDKKKSTVGRRNSTCNVRGVEATQMNGFVYGAAVLRSKQRSRKKTGRWLQRSVVFKNSPSLIFFCCERSRSSLRVFLCVVFQGSQR